MVLYNQNMRGNAICIVGYFMNRAYCNASQDLNPKRFDPVLKIVRATRFTLTLAKTLPKGAIILGI